LLFQSLDNKQECVGVYADGRIHYQDLPTSLTKTWDYSPVVSEEPIDYARFYAGGLSLADACPLSLQGEWLAARNKLKAFMRSFNEAQVSLHENCFFDLVPERFLLEFFYLKSEITAHAFENYERPPNHEFLVKVASLIHEVSTRPISVNKSALRPLLGSTRARNFWKKLDVNSRINYNLFGAKTGRLTTKKGSFPILTLDRGLRKVLEPTNDWFVELDFNAAELRTLLALSGSEQPEGDIHDWNIQNIFQGLGTREEAKKRVFSWLYNPSATDGGLGKTYDRSTVIKKYFDGCMVKTIFDRTIQADRHRALNYIIQSTTSDLFLDRAIAVNSLLKGRRSHVAFFIHDSLVLDVCDQEKDLLKVLIQEFGSTRLGDYTVNVSAGKNFGDMRKIQ